MRDRLSRCLTLAALCAIGTPAQAAATEPTDAAASPPSSGQALRKRGGYLTLAPGIIGFSLVASIPPFYVWGLDGGYHLPIGRVFAMQLGGSFEHVTHADANSIRLGAIGRFGGGNEKVFGYGLVRLGPDFYRPPMDLVDRVGFHGSLGCGVMGMVHRIVGLGGEAAVDMLSGGGEAAVDMLGGGGGIGYFARLRFFITLKF